MKRLGILNSDIARVLAYMGHTDTLAIGDCGLPVPDTTERIDLALEFGKPSFMDVLKPVSKDMKIEIIVLAGKSANRTQRCLHRSSSYSKKLSRKQERKQKLNLSLIQN